MDTQPSTQLWEELEKGPRKITLRGAEKMSLTNSPGAQVRQGQSEPGQGMDGVAQRPIYRHGTMKEQLEGQSAKAVALLPGRSENATTQQARELGQTGYGEERVRQSWTQSRVCIMCLILSTMAFNEDQAAVPRHFVDPGQSSFLSNRDMHGRGFWELHTVKLISHQIIQVGFRVTDLS